MATSNIQPIANMRARVEYVTYGRGEKRKEHLRNGTDRLAHHREDVDADAFCAYCAAKRDSYGRKWEGYELRVSFAPDELDPGNPDDLRRAADVAYEASGRLWPGRSRFIAVHVDGDGGCVHAHCEVCNHDPITGRAINSNTSHKVVSSVVDDVCRDRGLHVLGETAQEGTWAEVRRSRQLSPFERELGDRVAKCLRTSSSTADFKANLERSGVELRETVRNVKAKTGDKQTVTGWSYSMVDSTGPKRRRRRRKASSLCDEFTRDSVMARYGEATPRPPRQRVKNEPSHEQPDPRLHDGKGDGAAEAIGSWRARATMATMADECMLAKPNLYRQLRERLDAEGRDEFERDLQRMREHTEQARRELSQSYDDRRALLKKPENVAFKAAEKEIDRATAGDEDASMVAALTLLTVAMSVSLARSALRAGADSKIARSKAIASESAYRAYAAQTVLEQYDDQTGAIRAGGASSRQAGPGASAHARRQAQYQRQRTRSMGGPRGRSRGLSL